MRIREINDVIRPLLGQAPWRAQLGHGTFLTFDFGRERPPERPGIVTRGEWHLWTYQCAWRVERRAQVLAASGDEDLEVDAVLSDFEGRALRSVRVSKPTLDAAFAFEGGLVLKLFARVSREAEHWLLFTPREMVLVAGPGGTCRYAPSNAPSA